MARGIRDLDHQVEEEARRIGAHRIFWFIVSTRKGHRVDYGFHREALGPIEPYLIEMVD